MEKLRELISEINNLKKDIDTLKKTMKVVENEKERVILKLIEKEN